MLRLNLLAAQRLANLLFLRALLFLLLDFLPGLAWGLTFSFLVILRLAFCLRRGLMTGALDRYWLCLEEERETVDWNCLICILVDSLMEMSCGLSFLMPSEAEREVG